MPEAGAYSHQLFSTVQTRLGEEEVCSVGHFPIIEDDEVEHDEDGLHDGHDDDVWQGVEGGKPSGRTFLDNCKGL